MAQDTRGFIPGFRPRPHWFCNVEMRSSLRNVLSKLWTSNRPLISQIPVSYVLDQILSYRRYFLDILAEVLTDESTVNTFVVLRLLYVCTEIIKNIFHRNYCIFSNTVIRNLIICFCWWRWSTNFPLMVLYI